jgi:uncharacterized OsmC-like protein
MESVFSQGGKMMSKENVVNGIDAEALRTMIGRFRQQPSLGKSRFRVRNRWVEGGFNQTIIQGFYAAEGEDTSRSEAFELEADEPPVLLGKNRGPNPVEYLLTALASCLTSSMVYHAAARGIRIEELESEVDGDLDLRGFMGIAADVKKGYQNIRVNFKVRSDASAEQLKELALFSPVFDTISSPVPVTVIVEKKDAARSAEVLEHAGAGAR